MFSFFKKSNKKVEVPEWASYLTEEQYSKFITEVEGYFKRKKLKFQRGGGMIKVLDGELKDNSFGLQNLSQSCNHLSLKDYRSHIEGHFEGMFQSFKFMKEVDEIKGDFEKIKKYIAVKIYPSEFVLIQKDNPGISKKITESLYAVLVFDLPHSINNVQQEEADKWGIDNEELFRIGKKNTRHNYPNPVLKQEAQGIELFSVSTEHFFSSSIILDLETRPDLVGSKGCLLGLPTRHLTIIYPIENIEVAAALNMMIPANYNICKAGPGSMTDELIWYHDGVFETQPYTFSEGKIEFTPTENFVQMLNLMQ